MQIYLLQDVPSLGRKGEIHKVSLGYARNFLFPKKLAQIATPQIIKQAEEKKKIEEAQQKERKEKAEKLANEIKKTHITIPLKFAKGGKEAYASANKNTIVTTLAQKGISIKEDQIQLKNPLKEVGDYSVTINIYEEITAPLKVTIIAQK